MVTNLDSDAGDDVATALEEFATVVKAAGWRGVQLRSPPQVVILRSRQELNTYAPTPVDGYFADDGSPTGLVVTHAGPVEHRSATLKHELAHALTHQMGILSHAPPWLAEGIADYLETARYDPEMGDIVFGAVNRNGLAWVRAHGVVPFEELWAPHWSPADGGVLYGSSWLLVHYLYNQHRDRFIQFQARLNGTIAPRALWREMFPDLDPSTIQRNLDAYATDGKFTVYRLPASRPGRSTVSRPLSDAEVHATRARLYASAYRIEGVRRTLVQQEIQVALSEDPFNLSALSLRHVWLSEGPPPVQVARRLVGIYAGDARAWHLLSDAHAQAGESDLALEALARARALGWGTKVVVHPARPE